MLAGGACCSLRVGSFDKSTEIVFFLQSALNVSAESFCRNVESTGLGNRCEVIQVCIYCLVSLFPGSLLVYGKTKSVLDPLLVKLMKVVRAYVFIYFLYFKKEKGS